MAISDNEIKLILQAQDNTSSALNSVAKGLDGVKSSLDKTVATTQKYRDAQGDLAAATTKYRASQTAAADATTRYRDAQVGATEATMRFKDSQVAAQVALASYREEQAKAVQQSMALKAANAAAKEEASKKGGDAEWLKTMNRVTNEVTSSMYSLQGAANNATSAVTALGQVGTQGIRAVGNALISALQAAGNLVSTAQIMAAALGSILNVWLPGAGLIISIISNIGAVGAQVFLGLSQVAVAVWREIGAAAVHTITTIVSGLVSLGGFALQGVIGGIVGIGTAIVQAGKSIGGFVADILNVGPAFEAATQPGNLFAEMLRNNIVAGAAFAAGMAIAKAAIDGVKSAFSFLTNAFIEYNSEIELATVAFEAYFKSIGKEANEAKALAGGFLDRLQEIAASTPAEFGDLVKAAQGFVGMGLAAEQTIPVLQDVISLMGAMGKSGKELPGIGKALQDIYAKGRVSAQDMRQLAEHGIPAWKYLAEAEIEAAKGLGTVGEFGVKAGDSVAQAIGKIRKASEAGAVPASKVFEAIHRAASDPRIAEAMAGINDSWAVAVSNIGDRAKMLVRDMTEPIFKGLTQIALWFGRFLDAAPVKEFAKSIGDTFRYIGTLLAPIGDIFQAALKQFEDGDVSGALQTITNGFSTFAKDMFGAGWNVIAEFAQGMWAGANQLLDNVAGGIAQMVADFFIGHSPPPKGPLRIIDQGGHQLIMEWLQGMDQAPIEAVVGNIGQRVKDALAGKDGGEAPVLSLNDAKTRVQDIMQKDAPTNRDLEAVKNIATQVEGVISGIKDQVAEWRQEQDDVRFAIRTIKDTYEDQINALKEQVDLIEDQNKAYYEQIDLTDRLAQIQIDRQRIHLQGDPVARANIEGQIELLKSQEKQLSLEEKMASVEEARKNFAKQMRDYQRASAEFDRSAASAAAHGRVFRGERPEKPDERKFNLAQKRLGIEVQIAKLEQQRDNLGDKKGLAELKVKESILKVQSELNRLDKEENEIRNKLTALPLVEQIKELTRKEKEALEGLQDYDRLITRQIDLLENMQNAWSRFGKELKDDAEILQELVTGNENASEEIKERGKRIAQNLIGGIKAFWDANYSQLIFGSIGSQIGAIFGPIGAIVGGVFGAKFGGALKEADNDWPKHLQETVDGVLNWFQQRVTDVAKYFGAWDVGASAGAKGIGEALSGVSTLIDALKLALTGDFVGAISTAAKAFGLFGAAIADIIVQVGKWVNLDLDSQGSMFANIGQIIVKVASDIYNAIRSIVDTVAGWLNIPMDDSTSIWTTLGQIIPATAAIIVTAITTVITWLDELLGKNPGEAKTLWDKIVDIWNGIRDGVATAIETIKGLIDSLIGYKEGESTSRWDALLKTFDDIKNKVTEVITNVIDLIARLTGANIGQTNWETMASIFDKLRDAAVTAFDWARKKIQEFVDFIGDPATAKQLTLIKDIMVGIVEQIGRFFGFGGDKTELGQTWTDMIEGPKSNTMPKFENFFSSLLRGFAGITVGVLNFMDVLNTVGEVALSIVNVVTMPIMALIHMTQHLTTALVELLIGRDPIAAAKQLGLAIISAANDMGGAFGAALGGPARAIMEANERISKRNKDLLESQTPDLKKAAENQQKEIGEAATRAAAQEQKSREQLANMAGGGTNPAAAATEATKKATPELAQATKAAGEAATDGIKTGMSGSTDAASAALVGATKAVAQSDGDFKAGGIVLGTAAVDGVAQGAGQSATAVDGPVSLVANTIWQHTAEFSETGRRLGAAVIVGMVPAVVFTNELEIATSNVAYGISLHEAEFKETGARLGLALDLGIMQSMDDNLKPLITEGSAARLLNALWTLSETNFAPTGAYAGEQWTIGFAKSIDDKRDELVIDGAVARLLKAMWDLSEGKFTETGIHDAEGWLKGIVETIDDKGDELVINGAVARLLKALWDLADTKFYATGVHDAESLMRGIRDGIDENSDAVIGAVERILNLIYTKDKKFEETGKHLGESFLFALINSLDDQLEALQGAIQRILYEIYKLQENFRTTGQNAGNAFMAGLLSSLATGVASAGKAGSLIGDALLAGLLGSVQGAQQSGEYVADGYIQGVEAGSPAAIAAGEVLGMKPITGIEVATDQASPSKEAIKRGQNIAIGLVQGINADAAIARNIGIIVREALNANVDPVIALALAKVESGFKADALGDWSGGAPGQGHARSVGLFQLNEDGAGHGLTEAQRMDPTTNARTFFAQEGSKFAAAVQKGLQGANLAVEFGRTGERPKEGTEGKYGQAFNDLMKILMQTGRQGGGPVATLGAGGNFGPAPTAAPRANGNRLADNFRFVNQLSIPGLTAEQAFAACGPAAAMAFAQAAGRNPTAQEAMAIASQIGWTKEMGMGGVDNFMQLAQRLGARVQKMPATQENIDTQLKAGRPFALSTPDHYFQVAGGQQGAGGKLNVGSSGSVYRQGSENMTIKEMENVAGTVQDLVVLMGDLSDTTVVATNTAGDAVTGSARTQIVALTLIQRELQALIEQYQTAGSVSDEESRNILANAGTVTGATQSILAGLLAPPPTTGKGAPAGTTPRRFDNEVYGVPPTGGRQTSPRFDNEILPGTGAFDPTRRPPPGTGLQNPGRDIKGDLGSTIGNAGVVAAGAIKPIQAFIQAVAGLKPQIEAGAIAGMGLQEQIINIASATKQAEGPLRNLQAGTESTQAAMADIIGSAKGLSTDFLDLWNRLQDGKVNIQDATNQFFNLLAVFKETPQAAEAAGKAIAAATARANAAPKPGEIWTGQRAQDWVNPRAATAAASVATPARRDVYDNVPSMSPRSTSPTTGSGMLMMTPEVRNAPRTPNLVLSWSDAQKEYDDKIKALSDHVQQQTQSLQKLMAQSAQKITLPQGADIINANIDALVPKDLPMEVQDRIRAQIKQIQDAWKKYQEMSKQGPDITYDAQPNARYDPTTKTRVPLNGAAPTKPTTPTTPTTTAPPGTATPTRAQVPTPDPRQAEAAGTAATQAVATGIQSGLPQIQAALAMITDQLTNLSATLVQISAQMGEGITAGMQALVGAIQGAQSSAGAAAQDLGNSIVQGFYNAIQSIYNAVPIAQDAVSKLFEAMETEAEVASPSKKSEKIGTAIGQGLGKGIKEYAPQLEAIMKQITAQFLGQAFSLGEMDAKQWGLEKQILELSIRKAIEEEKLIPIKKEIAQLTREIASIEKGSLADRLRLVQIDGRRMQIELAQLQAQKQIRAEFGAEQDRIGKRELEVAAALAQAELARVPLQIKIKNLQEDIADIQRGSLEDQLKSFDLETERMQLNLQAAVAQQAINAQFKDLLGMEQQLAQFATQRARADLEILPTKQKLAAVDRQIAKVQKGSLTEQIADIRRDETRTKNKIRQLEIEKELNKLKKDPALEGDALFEANARRFGMQDRTTSLTGQKVGELERELDTINEQNEELDKQEEMQKLLRDLAIIGDRITKATLEDAIQQHEELYQSLYDETELLQAQKALREAEKAELEAMLLGPIKQRQEELSAEIDIIKQRNELAARGRERELIILQDQLHQMELQNRELENEKTLLDAQKAALDAAVALREYQLTGPLKRELEILEEEAQIIELQNKLRAQPQRERLVVLEYELELQSKTLNEIEDQLEALQKQKAVLEAIANLYDAIADRTELPGEGDKTEDPGKGGKGGKSPSLPNLPDPGKIKETETAVKNLGIALEHLSNGNYVLTLDDKVVGLTQSQLEDLQRQLELLPTDAPGKIVIDGKQIDLTAEQIGRLKGVIGTLPEGIDLKIDDKTLIRVATQDIPGLKTQLESVATNGGVVNINGQNIALTKEKVQELLNQINGIQNQPGQVNIKAPDVTPIDGIIAGLQADLLGLNATVTSPDITADDMAAAQAKIAEIQGKLDALRIFQANPTVDLNDPNAIATKLATLQGDLLGLEATIASPTVTAEEMAAAQAAAASIKSEITALQTIQASPQVKAESLANAATAAQAAEAAVGKIDDVPVTPTVDTTNLDNTTTTIENMPDPAVEVQVDGAQLDTAVQAAAEHHPVVMDTEVNQEDLNKVIDTAKTVHPANFDDEVVRTDVDKVITDADQTHPFNFDDVVNDEGVQSVIAEAARQHNFNFDDVVNDEGVQAAIAEAARQHDVNFDDKVQSGDLQALFSQASQTRNVNFNAQVSNQGTIQSWINSIVGKVWQITFSSNAPGRATGGHVDPKAYVVGERGPELFVPWTSGKIIPNARSMDMMKKAGYEGRATGGNVSSGMSDWTPDQARFIASFRNRGGGGGGGSEFFTNLVGQVKRGLGTLISNATEWWNRQQRQADAVAEQTKQAVKQAAKPPGAYVSQVGGGAGTGPVYGPAVPSSVAVSATVTLPDPLVPAGSIPAVNVPATVTLPSPAVAEGSIPAINVPATVTLPSPPIPEGSFPAQTVVVNVDRTKIDEVTAVLAQPYSLAVTVVVDRTQLDAIIALINLPYILNVQIIVDRAQLDLAITDIQTPRIMPSTTNVDRITLDQAIVDALTQRIMAVVTNLIRDTLNTAIADALASRTMPVTTEVNRATLDAAIAAAQGSYTMQVQINVSDGNLRNAVSDATSTRTMPVNVQMNRGDLDRTISEASRTYTMTVNVKTNNPNPYVWQVGGQRAKGGPVDSPQTYVVGERGPELFVPHVDGRILPADVTRRLMERATHRANGGLVSGDDDRRYWPGGSPIDPTTGLRWDDPNRSPRIPIRDTDDDRRYKIEPWMQDPGDRIRIDDPGWSPPDPRDLIRRISALSDVISNMIESLVSMQRMLNLDGEERRYVVSQGQASIGQSNSVVANNPTGIATNSSSSTANKTTNLTVNYNHYGRKEVSGQSELSDIVRDAVRYSESMG